MRLRFGLVGSVLLSALLGLSGCASQVNKGAPAYDLAPAQKPSYEPGTAYIYANRRLEQVESTRNGRTLWKDQNDRWFSRDDNFVVPALSWETRKGVYTQAVVKGDPDRLFPLGRGETVWFDVVKTRPDGRQYTNRWRCKDEGGRTIDWQDEPADTYLVSCVRHYLSRGANAVAAQQLDYFYSPSLGAVLRTDYTNLRMYRTPRQKTLVTALSPDEATPERIASERERLRAIASNAGEE